MRIWFDGGRSGQRLGLTVYIGSRDLLVVVITIRSPGTSDSAQSRATTIRTMLSNDELGTRAERWSQALVQLDSPKLNRPRKRATETKETRVIKSLQVPDKLVPQLREFFGVSVPEDHNTKVEGNSRLTAVNGMMLLVLLAVEGVTVLNVRGMITLHIYLGILLVGPVLLKSVSTIYRFVRYYTGAPAYVQKGPPHPILRVLGPFVILSSVAVLGTGIGLVFVGQAHREPLLTLHQASFIVWLVVVTIHVLGHIFHASTTTWRELRDPRVEPAVRGRRRRTLTVAASLVVGVGLATALMPSAHSWTSQQLDQHRDHKSNQSVTSTR